MGDPVTAVFASRRDPWLVVVLGGAAVIELGAAAGVLFGQGRIPSAAEAAVATVLVAASAFIMWTLFGTRYVIAGGVLTVRCGPFRWRMPIASIRGLRAVVGFMSAPALSLHRLALDVRGRGGALEISPADPEGFARAVGLPLDDGTPE
jgi:hypothetical protein